MYDSGKLPVFAKPFALPKNPVYLKGVITKFFLTYGKIGNYGTFRIINCVNLLNSVKMGLVWCEFFHLKIKKVSTPVGLFTIKKLRLKMVIQKQMVKIGFNAKVGTPGKAGESSKATFYFLKSFLQNESTQRIPRIAVKTQAILVDNRLCWKTDSAPEFSCYFLPLM